MRMVKQRVAKVRSYWIIDKPDGSHTHDDESAHAEEDALYLQVLRQIADGDPNGQRLAEAALETQDFMFCRWYS